MTEHQWHARAPFRERPLCGQIVSTRLERNRLEGRGQIGWGGRGTWMRDSVAACCKSNNVGVFSAPLIPTHPQPCTHPLVLSQAHWQVFFLLKLIVNLRLHHSLGTVCLECVISVWAKVINTITQRAVFTPSQLVGEERQNYSLAVFFFGEVMPMNEMFSYLY